MNKRNLLLGLAVALCVVAGLGLGLVGNTSAAVQSYTLDWSVVGGGGNAGTQLSSTVGQTTTGWSTGDQQLGSGFWYGVGAAGYSLYLPLTLKNH
ncbi:MAG TPA: hypothetical protein ENJ31_03720 [Anaerolineae bacterium]|nr:hypothetical protein [Anaerolineae bacterium]